MDKMQTRIYLWARAEPEVRNRPGGLEHSWLGGPRGNDFSIMAKRMGSPGPSNTGGLSMDEAPPLNSALHEATNFPGTWFPPLWRRAFHGDPPLGARKETTMIVLVSWSRALSAATSMLDGKQRQS